MWGLGVSGLVSLGVSTSKLVSVYDKDERGSVSVSCSICHVSDLASDSASLSVSVSESMPLAVSVSVSMLLAVSV